MNKATKFDLVPFHDHHIMTAEIDGRVHVVMKPIVEMMHLQWRGQLERIKNHAVLAEGVQHSYIPSAGGQQEMVCLELEAFHGWLITISPGKIPNEESRAMVLDYQRRAFRVLFEHFHGPITSATVSAISDRLLFEIRKQARALMHEYADARTVGEKKLIHGLLTGACQQLGIYTPTIEEFETVLDDDDQPLIDAFWSAFHKAEAAGHTCNHSRNNHHIAINFPEFRDILAGMGIALLIDRTMMAALRRSKSPVFVASKTVNCRDGKPRQCAVFAMPVPSLLDAM